MNKRLQVLIIDDDLDHLEITRISLNKQSKDLVVSTASSAREGLSKLQRRHFDVVLLDYNLPEISGLGLLKQLREKNATIPVVFVTGEGNEKIAVEAMKAGASDYIIKEGAYLKMLPRVIERVYKHVRLQEQLRKSQERYRHLFHEAYDAILLIDSESYQILESNKQAAHLFGRPESSLNGQSPLSLCDNRCAERFLRALHTAKESGAAQLDEFRIIHADGSVRTVEVSLTVVESGGDHILQCMLRDMTEKKILQRQILTSKLRLQALFDGIQDLISVQDEDYNIVMANSQAARWANTTPGSLIGRKCYDVFFNRMTPCHNCPISRTMQEKQSHFLETSVADDVLHIRTYPMAGLEDEPAYAIEHIRVVTEQKRLEEQLIHSEKLATIGILSSGIAHELRNPLNIIEAARYYLAETIPPEEDDLHNKLSIIRVNIQRSSKIINNLLEFSRKNNLDRQEVDINYLLESTIGLIEKELRVRDVIIVRSFESNVICEVNIDGVRHVFLNLIMNAMQAMPDGGELRIHSYVDPEDGFVCVEFADTGMGISEENLKNIFAPFYTTKPVGEGTGLGLHIANSIVLRHNGEITVRSKPGQGTTFTVRLPISGPPLEHRTEAETVEREFPDLLKIEQEQNS